MKSRSFREWMERMAILAVVFALAPQARADTETVDGVTWTYTVSNGMSTVTGASPAEGEMTIPSMLGGCPVTAIHNHAFSMKCVRSMTIPDSVTRIDDAAFFASCLTNVLIGNGVSSIGSIPFLNCMELETITVVAGNEHYASEDGVLFDKAKTTLLLCPEGKRGVYEVPDGVLRIGSSACYPCRNLTEIILPDSLTSIEYNAFGYCGALISMTIPGNVTNIADCAFQYCRDLVSVAIPARVSSIGSEPFAYCGNLETITVAAGNEHYSSENGVLFDKAMTTLVQCPGGKSGEYELPRSVTSIGEQGFIACSNLTSVIIPVGVTDIGESAFHACERLLSVSIPDSVTNIGKSAFSDCRSLKQVTIGNGVTSIPDSAFYDCFSLGAVIVPNSVTNIGVGAFHSCFSLKDVVIPDSVKTIGDDAFAYCNNLSEVAMPDSVERIGDWAFSACPSLASITIPASVGSIGKLAFSSCTNLSSVCIPDGVTSIGEKAFWNCSGLRMASIPDSVTEVGSGVFSDCGNLTILQVPESWETLGLLDDAGVPASCQVVYGEGGWTWHVAAATGSDANDGMTAGTAFATIQKAIDAAWWGDRIVVGDGVYGPISATNQLLDIVSLNGAAATVIDGGGARRAATLSDADHGGAAGTNVHLKGFTLRNGAVPDGSGGGAWGGLLEGCVVTGNTARNGGGSFGGVRVGCVISGNTATDSGGGMHGGTAIDCELSRNTASVSGGGICGGTLERCVVSGNTAGFMMGGGCMDTDARNCLIVDNSAAGDFLGVGGGAFQGHFDHCTFVGNTAIAGGGVIGSTVKNSVFSGNTGFGGAGDAHQSDVSWSLVADVYELTGSGEGNIAGDPLFADAAGGDYRLTASSPCVNAGEPGVEFPGTDLAGEARTKDGRTDMGAYEFDLPGVSGVWVRNPVGGGVTPAGGTTLETGKRGIWKAYGPRTFLGFYTNGAFATSNASIRLVGGGDDIVLEAMFLNEGPISVFANPSAAAGGNGGTAQTAVQTLQEAIDLAAPGDTVVAAPGVYGPISSGNKAIEIRGSGTVRRTIIDGGRSGRCATLGANSEETATRLVGFTVRSGFLASDPGGGVLGGTAENCVIQGNTAPFGGGAAYGILKDCTVSGNNSGLGGGMYRVRADNCTIRENTASGYGGGAQDSVLLRCVLERNACTNSGGGADMGMLNRCVVRGNTAGWDGGGVSHATAMNSLVVGNRAGDNGGGVFGDYVNGPANLVNCTVAGNVAGGIGGGVAARIADHAVSIGLKDDSRYAAVTLNNSIVWGNALSGGLAENYGTLGSNWSVRTEAGSGILAQYTCSAPALEGAGNIEKEPIFAGADDWRLAEGSPCADAGSDGYRTVWMTYAADVPEPVCVAEDGFIGGDWLDLAGASRRLLGAIDMGAYERTEGRPGEVPFEGIWGAWSSESVGPPRMPTSARTWEELARAAWAARDAFVRSGSRTEVPPTDEPIVLSLGAVAIPLSMLPKNGAGLATETEQGVPVWRLHLREKEGLGSHVFEATVGGTPVDLGISPPFYPGESWVRAVYGEVPPWLDAEGRASWLAERARTRIEWYATLVAEGDWAGYEANRAADAAAVRGGGGGADALEIAGIQVGGSEDETHRLSIASGAEEAAVRLLGGGDLVAGEWAYRGLALQRAGTGAAGVPAGRTTEFWMAVRGDEDSDGDGVPDVVERHVLGSDPARRDTTGSGLNDWEKVYRYGLLPTEVSTAGDGISDAEKVATGKDPAQPVSASEATAAQTSIRYAYDEDDRLVGTWFGAGGGGTTTGLSPVGNPETIRQRNANP